MELWEDAGLIRVCFEEEPKEKGGTGVDPERVHIYLILLIKYSFQLYPGWACFLFCFCSCVALLLANIKLGWVVDWMRSLSTRTWRDWGDLGREGHGGLGDMEFWGSAAEDTASHRPATALPHCICACLTASEEQTTSRFWVWVAREEECAGALHTAHDYGNFGNFGGAGKDTMPVLGCMLV